MRYVGKSPRGTTKTSIVSTETGPRGPRVPARVKHLGHLARSLSNEEKRHQLLVWENLNLPWGPPGPNRSQLQVELGPQSLHRHPKRSPRARRVVEVSNGLQARTAMGLSCKEGELTEPWLVSEVIAIQMSMGMRLLLEQLDIHTQVAG